MYEVWGGEAAGTLHRDGGYLAGMGSGRPLTCITVIHNSYNYIVTS